MALLFLSHNKWRLKKDTLVRLEIAFAAGVWRNETSRNALRGQTARETWLNSSWQMKQTVYPSLRDFPIYVIAIISNRIARCSWAVKRASLLARQRTDVRVINRVSSSPALLARSIMKRISLKIFCTLYESEIKERESREISFFNLSIRPRFGVLFSFSFFSLFSRDVRCIAPKKARYEMRLI